MYGQMDRLDEPRPGSRRGLLVFVLAAIVSFSPCCLAQTEERSEAEGLWLTLVEDARTIRGDLEAEAAHLTSEAVEGTEKLLRVLREDYTPILRDAGFEVSQVRATLGLPPEIAVRVKPLGSSNARQRDALLEKHAGDKILHGLLKGLFAIETLDVEGYALDEAQITAGIPPKATLILTPTTER
ncbi:MAG: hypothetical protein AAF657_26435 [Acidobacteriota bacterium]